MSEPARTVVTFVSTSFNTMESKDYFINPYCFGDDVAKWIIERLKSQGIHAEEPGQEDFGWFFNFHVGDAGYCLVIGWRPGDDEDQPGTWIAWIERSLGLLASLLGRRNKGLTPEASRVIHRALAGAPEIRDIRWHLKADFDKNHEERATPEP